MTSRKRTQSVCNWTRPGENAVEKEKEIGARFVDTQDHVGLAKDEMNLFGGLPDWTNTSIQKKKNQFADTEWLVTRKQYKKKKKKNKKSKTPLPVKSLIEKKTDDILDMFRLEEEEEHNPEEAEEQQNVHSATTITTPSPTTDAEIKHIFELMDKDGSGIVSYTELLRSFRTVAVQDFINARPELAKLLTPSKISSTMKLILNVDEHSNEHIFNLHSFNMFCNEMIHHHRLQDESTRSQETSSGAGDAHQTSLLQKKRNDLITVDHVFALLDENHDNELTYEECLHKLSKPSHEIYELIQMNESLSFLLHPSELKRTLKKIVQIHPLHKLTRGAFRMYISAESRRRKNK